MKPLYTTLSAALAATALAAPVEDIEKRATPKVYLAGDSTMALGGGGSGTQGEAQPPPSTPAPNKSDITLRLGRIPPLLLYRRNDGQRRSRRPLCPNLLQRITLYSHRQRCHNRRLGYH